MMINKHYKIILFYVVLFGLYPASLFSSESLPQITLKIEQQYLDELNAHPYRDDYFPCEVIFLGERQNAEVRFRGGSTRNLAKKNWKVKFKNAQNKLGRRILNLNAEYRDPSRMRNYLAMKFFSYYGIPASETDFMRLEMNGQDLGLYIAVEQVDEAFLAKHNRPEGELYKAKDHAALMVPIANYRDFSRVWDKKLGASQNDKNLLQFLAKVVNLNNEQFYQFVEENVELENFLTYYAITYAFASRDCFSKNFYFYRNPKTNKYELFPWDNDAILGMKWNGKIDEGSSLLKLGNLTRNALFRRMMEHDEWYEFYWKIIEEIRTEGFKLLTDKIKETRSLISEPLLSDTTYQFSIEAFQTEIDRIKTFLTERSEFLASKPMGKAIKILEWNASTAFPNKIKNSVDVTVKTDQPADLKLRYVLDLEFEKYGEPVTVKLIHLFDDGLHNDGQAGDLVYGNSIDFQLTKNAIIPFCFNTGGFDFPSNGVYYAPKIPMQSPAFHYSNDDFEHDFSKLKWHLVFDDNHDQIIKIKNDSDIDLDLGYLHFQGSEVWHDFIFSPTSKIASNDSIYLASNRVLASSIYPDDAVFAGMFFSCDSAGGYKLISPVGEVVQHIDLMDHTTEITNNFSVVINEVNFSSSKEYNAGDWIELYNSGNEAIDMTGWLLKDNDDKHIFRFEEIIVLLPGHFLVIYNNEKKFFRANSDFGVAVGEFDFGLSKNEDMVRLYSKKGKLVDYVSYSNKNNAWSKADDSFTLELLDTNLDNNISANWSKSKLHGGTPGKTNSFITGIAEQKQLAGNYISHAYPNPFSAYTQFEISLNSPQNVRIVVYDILGREVGEIVRQNLSSGRHVLRWEPETLANGVYFYKVVVANKLMKQGKVVYLAR